MKGISVVLPTWNRAALLSRAMRSVLDQTHPVDELIVVDDASTDDTAQVVAAFADPRIRYVRQPARGGVSAARNRGIGLAREDLVAFQDSDDAWLPHKLERQVAALADAPDALLTVTNTRVINGYPKSSAAPRADGRVMDVTHDCSLWLPGAPTWLAHRAALVADDGFDPSLNCYEDWDLALRLSKRGRILLVNEDLVICDQGPAGLFSDEGSRLRNLRLIVERHRATLARDPRAWAYYANALGQMSMQDGAPAEARRWFREAVRARPLAPRGWANFVMSLGGPALFSRYVRLARSMRGTLARLQA